jgi:hypothetical protein
VIMTYYDHPFIARGLHHQLARPGP